MNSPMEGAAFLFLWFGFLLLMTSCVALFILWGVRSGQFSNQERARYLALGGIDLGGGSEAAGADKGGGPKP